mgnify:FL=1|tara:strand:- start:2566 stop:3018 length:453 start_codon:yes stop_codon:yes gene_type:complete
MRYSEFKIEKVENRTDEVLPAIAGAVARGAANVGKSAVKAVAGSTVGKKLAAVGSSVASKVANKANDTLNKQLVKKGSSIPMPTKGGQEAEFEIDDVQGDEVTLINPDASKAPEEPEKLTYKKADIDTIVKGLQGDSGGGPNGTIGNQSS